MLLAIDIGNTNIVVGAFVADTIAARWRLATDPERMPDEYAVLLRALFDLRGLRPDAVDGCMICSVVPAVQSAMVETMREYWNLDPVVVTPALDTGVPVRYTPPHAVGADRIANAVAAIELYGCPCIVADFGTATTFDAISRDGAYVGGAIAPGLEVSEEALFSRTAQLPRVPLQVPETAVGSTTIESLQSGLLYGYAGLVDGLVERMRRELGPDTRAVATGGLSGVIAPLTSTLREVDVDLTLKGLAILYERNRQTDALGTRQDQPVA